MKKTIKSSIITLILATSNISFGQSFFDNFKANLADAFDSSRARIETYKQATDKPLLDHFLYLSEDGKTQAINKELASIDAKFEFVKFSNSSVTLKQRLFNENNMTMMLNRMRMYTYDATEDSIARRYISFVNARGNSIKLYKPVLGAKINRILNQNFDFSPDKGIAAWIDLDNALIETNGNGGIVSVMTRSHQANTTIGVRSYQYTNIYFGRAAAQIIENNIPNSDFGNNLIRTISGTEIVSPPNNESQPTYATTPAPTPVTQANPVQPSSSERSLEQRIKLLSNLNDLRKSGALTDKEFEVEKKKILAN
jgi:hypothetical protein